MKREKSNEEILAELNIDTELITSLAITEAELHALANSKLLGRLTCKDDLVFMLNRIRLAMSSTRMVNARRRAIEADTIKSESPVRLDMAQPGGDVATAKSAPLGLGLVATSVAILATLPLAMLWLIQTGRADNFLKPPYMVAEALLVTGLFAISLWGIAARR